MNFINNQHQQHLINLLKCGSIGDFYDYCKQENIGFTKAIKFCYAIHNALRQSNPKYFKAQ